MLAVARYKPQEIEDIVRETENEIVQGASSSTNSHVPKPSLAGFFWRIDVAPIN